MEYILDIDSDERDYTKYPNSNDFTIDLNRPLYSVSDFRLISANIPITQLTINKGNQNFEVDGQLITLEEKRYTDPSVLAIDLQSKLSPPTTNVDSVVFDTDTMSYIFSNTSGGINTFSFKFYSGQYGSNTNSEYGTTATILGFEQLDISSTFNPISGSHEIRGGVVDLHGPSSLLLRITNGSDDMQKKIYNKNGEFHYTARIMTSTNWGMMYYKGNDDPVEYYFQEGKFKSINLLRFRFYFVNGLKLIPYDFGNRNFSLKFKVTCYIDKLKPLMLQSSQEDVLTEEVVSPDYSKYAIVTLLTLGLLLLITFKQKPRISAVQAS